VTGGWPADVAVLPVARGALAAGWPAAAGLPRPSLSRRAAQSVEWSSVQRWPVPTARRGEGASRPGQSRRGRAGWRRKSRGGVEDRGSGGGGRAGERRAQDAIASGRACGRRVSFF